MKRVLVSLGACCFFMLISMAALAAPAPGVYDRDDLGFTANVLSFASGAAFDQTGSADADFSDPSVTQFTLGGVSAARTMGAYWSIALTRGASAGTGVVPWGADNKTGDAWEVSGVMSLRADGPWSPGGAGADYTVNVTGTLVSFNLVGGYYIGTLRLTGTLNARDGETVTFQCYLLRQAADPMYLAVERTDITEPVPTQVVISNDPPVTATPPTVSIGAVNGLGQTTATLNGAVNPNGYETDYFFEYGTDTSYGSTARAVARASAGSGTENVTVSVDLTGLSEETVYHCRLVAENEGGESVTGDVAFTTLSDEPAKSLDLVLAQAVNSGQFTGLGLDVYKADGTLDYSKAFGDSRLYDRVASAFARDQRYPIASASKMISATTILALIHALENDARGRAVGFTLNSKASEWLTDAAGGAPWAGPRGDITVAQCISMTTGLNPESAAIYDDTITLEQAVYQIYAENPSPLTPGTVFDYGGAHWAPAARMAELAYQQWKGDNTLLWKDLFRELMSQPLGWDAESKYFARPNQRLGEDNAQVAGGLTATMEEYGRYLAMLAAGGEYNGTRIVTQTQLDEQFTDHTAGVTTFVPPPALTANWRYGLGSWLECDFGNDTCDNPPVSSLGAYGWYPRLDRANGFFTLLGTYEPLGGSFKSLALYTNQLSASVDELMGVGQEEPAGSSNWLEDLCFVSRAQAEAGGVPVLPAALGFLALLALAALARRRVS